MAWRSSNANLSGADLSDANLSGADLNRVDLSGAKNLKNQNSSDYIISNFDKTDNGIIVYKTFDSYQKPNPNWKIEAGSILEEIVNFNRTENCGCGINVATLDWVRQNNVGNKDIWKCLIRWEWLSDVVVPYHTDGKIRAGRVQLLEIVE